LVLKGRERLAGRGEENPARPRVWPGNWLRRQGKAAPAAPCIGLRTSRRGPAWHAWSACKLVLGLVFFALVGGGFFVARVALGPLTLDGIAPQIAKALDDRFGHRYEFGFGGTAIVKNGAPALSIDKLSIKEPSGRMILTAPRAEVSVDLLALSVGRVTPRRLEIFDVEVHLTLRPDGSLALPIAFNSGEVVALTPPLASAPDSPLPPPDAGANEPVAQGRTAKPPPALIVKQMAASIRLVIDTLTNPASPAAAIDRIGITRGKIVIDD